MPFKDPAKRKEYQRRYHEKWYAQHRDERKQQVRERRQRIKKEIENLKREKSCADCGLSGEIATWALEFHHIDENTKHMNISHMVCNGYSIKRIKEEMEKCEVLCSNCHRTRHYRQHLVKKEKGESLVPEKNENILSGQRNSQTRTKKKQRRKIRKERMLRNPDRDLSGPPPQDEK